jgi:hypothetical protein
MGLWYMLLVVWSMVKILALLFQLMFVQLFGVENIHILAEVHNLLPVDRLALQEEALLALAQEQAAVFQALHKILFLSSWVFLP